MLNLPLHWSEGMFLRPHHFQAADRHWAELIQTSESWDHPYNYGLYSIELSPEAIANYQVQVSTCRARLKDGTLITLGAGQDLDRLDLRPGLAEAEAPRADLKGAFDSQSTVRVFLAVPKLRMGRANVAISDTSGNPRYVESVLSIQDESQGGNDQEIRLRNLNVKLMLSTQDLSGYETLPIAQIKRVGARENAPQLDDEYIPPVLKVEAWPGLGRDIIRAIYDLLGNRLDMFSKWIVDRQIAVASTDPGDQEKVLMLRMLNESYATLGCLTFATGVHPFTAYYELCRIVGKLSIFGNDRRVPEIPRYDHDDLARIFRWMMRQIELLLNIRQDEYEQRFFIGAGRGMQVAIESRWFSSDWSWYVGVNAGSLSARELLELLPTRSKPARLDWKLGSSRQVDRLFRQGIKGLDLEPLTQAPRILPATGGWVYFEVIQGNAAWKDVEEHQTLAMRLTESAIRNLDALEGQRTMSIAVDGKNADLQFALFAVRSPRT